MMGNAREEEIFCLMKMMVHHCLAFKHPQAILSFHEGSFEPVLFSDQYTRIHVRTCDILSNGCYLNHDFE